MIYLYAITEQLGALPEAVRGVDHAPLSLLTCKGLSAVISTVEATSVVPTPQRLWQHEQVVETLMMGTAVVPARFSTVFGQKEEVVSTLDVLHDQLKGDLQRVAGCVELGLRVLRMAEPETNHPENDGLPCPDLLATEKNGHTFEIAKRAADLHRAATRRRDESLGEMLHRTLAGYCTDHRVRMEQGPGMLIRASYLVEHRRLREMQQAVQELMKTYKSLHFLCTGPWPPYHFVRPIEPEPIV